MRKSTIIKLFFSIEISLFCWLYYAGTHGVRQMREVHLEITQIEQSMMHLEDEIKIVEDQIHAWHSDDFYKEKLAREQLHMARADEEIYIL